ncbi:hypothetical protein ACFLRZ_02675 [Bacteroidota bacterium]
MKRFLLLFIVLSSNLIFAQDIIIKHSGEEIKAKVLEITSENIKYKAYEYQDGPIRNANISEVFMIIYENGSKEIFNKKELPSKDYEYTTSIENIRNGLHLGLHITPGIGKVFFENCNFGFGYSSGLDLNIYFNNYVGIKSGISFMNMPLKYSSEFYDYYTSSTNTYKSSGSISSIGVPIKFLLTTGNTVGLYFEAGFDIYFPIESKMEADSFSSSGFHKSEVIAAEINLGLNIKTSDFMSINITFFEHYSITGYFENEDESRGFLIGLQMGILFKLTK